MISIGVKSVDTNAVDSILRSEDKFRSVGKWPAFRKSAEEGLIVLVEDDFGGSEIQCAQCKAVVGNLYHDGKKSGDEHPDAKDRHCLESAQLTFEPASLDEPAPTTPSHTPQISLNVQEVTETPSTMPAGMTQPSQTKLRSSKSTSLRASRKSAAPSSPSSSASHSKDQEAPGISATVVGVVAVAAIAITGLAIWAGFRRSNNKK